MAKTTDAPRPTPESLLSLASRDSSRGKLKVYLGMAAGVGKTYRMLDDANALRRQGTDIVIGYIETHGRAETGARIGELEGIPRKRIHYNGVLIEHTHLHSRISRH